MSVPDIQHALELLRQRDVDAAISTLERKVEELPAHLTAHVLLARAYEANQDWDRALRSWENAHFLMPNSPLVQAGKERVIENIEATEASSEDGDSGNAPSASETSSPSRGDASPTSTPPQPSASAESTSQEDVPSPTTAPEDLAEQATPPPSAKSTPDQDTAETPDGESANPIAQQAQALLSGTPSESSDEADEATPPSAAPEPTPSATHPSRQEPATPSPDPPTSAPEIRASRSPDTTSYRPDTAIIDAAASLLSRKPTPVADAPDDPDVPAQEQPQRTEDDGAGRAGQTATDDTAATGAESFIPDFAARQTGSTKGSDADVPAAEPQESKSPASDEADEGLLDSPFLDRSGTAETGDEAGPPDAPSSDEKRIEESGQARPADSEDDDGEPSVQIPSPDDLMPSDTDLDTLSDGDDDSEDGLSELEKLRQSAEREARSGGARAGMSRPDLSSGAEDSVDPDDTIGDLDRLIQDLESARIEPKPDLDDLPEPDLEDDVEDLVSETLARIYAAQSQYREAARIYVKLASQEPANARAHLENAAEMRKKADAKAANDRADGDASDA
ncbi:MAG: hypothetical protein GVY25_13800 [Bacteroidetes bacterium]|jgi:tetratricopeptide (TPR) repeat protein|nr:hypothetical protein [Bacteroidota bacterium]